MIFIYTHFSFVYNYTTFILFTKRIYQKLHNNYSVCTSKIMYLMKRDRSSRVNRQFLVAQLDPNDKLDANDKLSSLHLCYYSFIRVPHPVISLNPLQFAAATRTNTHRDHIYTNYFITNQNPETNDRNLS